MKKLGVEIAKLPEYLKHLQGLGRKFEDLKKSFGNTSSRTTQLENKYRRLDEKVGGLENLLNSLRRNRKLLEMRVRVQIHLQRA